MLTGGGAVKYIPLFSKTGLDLNFKKRISDFRFIFVDLADKMYYIYTL